ncbi:MAG: SpoIIE family protein phosphatase [Bacteroidota bacterium]
MASQPKRAIPPVFTTKAIWRIGIILTLNIGLCIFVLTSIRQINRYQELRSTLDEVLIRTELARLSERNFLLNSAITEEFITTGEDPEIQAAHQNIDENIETLAGLMSSSLVDREEMRDVLDSIRTQMVIYRVAFDRIVTLYQEKGFRDWGLEGEMRAAIHHIEDSPLPLDLEYMLMLRRHEKDFLLRRDLSYEKKFQEGTWAFRSHLDQMRNSANQEELQLLIDTLLYYESIFYRIVAIEEEIGLQNEEGIKGQMNVSASIIAGSIENTLTYLNNRVDVVTQNLVLAIAILFFISTALLIFRTMKTLRQEDIIHLKNKDLEKSNEDITASINYARRIQQGILSHAQYVTDIFSEFLILYRPRDIVSGDFYWFAHKDEKVVVAVVDCTGHGVPGAFMTVLANALLNQVVIEKGIDDPAEILHELDEHLSRILKQGGSDRAEGMDMSVLTLNVLDNTLEYGGAKSNLYLFQGDDLRQVKGDKFSIGSHKLIKEKHFSTHRLHLQKGDTLYLFTDGFPDQFGGEDSRKFMIKNFRELLRDIHWRDLAFQEKTLEDKLEKWMGKHKQTDDITVVGLRL